MPRTWDSIKKEYVEIKHHGKEYKPKSTPTADKMEKHVERNKDTEWPGDKVRPPTMGPVPRDETRPVKNPAGHQRLVGSPRSEAPYDPLWTPTSAPSDGDKQRDKVGTTSTIGKYKEDEILADVQKYIASTFTEHYNDDENVELFDAWISLGNSTPTFRNNAIKYLWRYGKKEGSNKKDLLKAMHYITMMLYVDHYKD